MKIIYTIAITLLLFVARTQSSSSDAEQEDSESRMLQATPANGNFPGRFRRDIKRATAKLERLKKLLRTVETGPNPDSFVPEPWCKPHQPLGPAIFAAAMSVESRRPDALMFAGTARASGFSYFIYITR